MADFPSSQDNTLVLEVLGESYGVCQKMEAFYKDAAAALERMRAKVRQIKDDELRANLTRTLDGMQVSMARPDTKAH